MDEMRYMNAVESSAGGRLLRKSGCCRKWGGRGVSVRGMTVRDGGSVEVDAEPSGRTLRVRLCVA